MKKGNNRNFFKRVGDWFKLTWESFVVEVQDRVFMSWKRLIKFVGISIIPIVYGVVCVIAFWNPIQGIGKAPVAIMNQDNPVLLVRSANNDGELGYSTGTVSKINGTNDPNEIANFFKLDKKYIINESINDKVSTLAFDRSLLTTKEDKDYVTTQILSNLQNDMKFTLTSEDETGKQIEVKYYSNDPSFSIELTSIWDTLKKSFIAKDDEAEPDTKHTFKTEEITEGIALTNVKYIDDNEEINNQWKKTKYYAQIKIPESYSGKIFKYIGDMIAGSRNESIDDLVDSMDSIDIWTTFERNFIFGYYLNTISNVAGGMALKSLPELLNGLVLDDLNDSLTVNGTMLKELIGIDSDQDVKEIDTKLNYVIADASSFPNNNEDKLKNYSLFGKLIGNTAEEIGGKFINTILKMEKVANSDNFWKLIGKLTGVNGDNIKEIINKIIEIIKNINGKDDENSKPENTYMNESSYNNAYIEHAGLIELNKVMYDIFNGNKKNIPDKVKNAISKIYEIITGKEMQWQQFNPVSLFNKNSNGDADLTTEKEFQDNVNKLVVANPNIFFNAETIDDFLGNVKENFNNERLHGIFEKNKLLSVEIQGQKFGQYGMGLGEFFLVIGLYIGGLLQTFIFDRAKRLTKAKWSNWYVSKWMLMVLIASVQVTAEVWVAYAVGWSQIGPTAMTYVWLWLWFSNIVFVTIVQGLWFIIKDEAIGRFLCVIVLVLSLTSGGGTFPAFTQFGFFTAIGKVVPFTYVLNGLGEITYGVSLMGTQAYTTEFIFTQFGILWIYIAIFFTIGALVGGRNRMKDMDYGSHYGFAVAHAMRELGRSTEGFQILKRTKNNGKHVYKYNWKALKPGFDPELYFKCRELHKFEGEFKWWARKPHDFVQKPNYSDEDTITRNE